MSNFIFALRKELFKLIHKRKYIVLTIIGVLISLGRWGGSALIAKLSNGYVNIKANIGLEMLPFAVEILIPVKRVIHLPVPSTQQNGLYLMSLLMSLRSY